MANEDNAILPKYIFISVFSLVIVLIIYNIFIGLTVSEIGIPGFTVKFGTQLLTPKPTSAPTSAPTPVPTATEIILATAASTHTQNPNTLVSTETSNSLKVTRLKEIEISW